MRIYKDKKTGKYHADYTVKGRRVRPSLHTKNSQIALVRAAEITKGASPETYPGCTFDQLLERYRNNLLSLKSEATRKRFDSSLNRLKQFRWPKLVTDINPAFLQEFQVFLKSISTSGKSAGINRNVRSIVTLMRQAEAWDIIAPQRWTNVKKLKEPKGRVVFHTPEEIARILDRCVSDSWRLVVLLGCRAGLRRGEIAALRWQDVDLQNKQLYIAPNKTEKHRYVPLDRDLEDALKRVRKHASDEYVIHVGEDDARHSPYYITAAYAKQMKQLPFHCFLHKLRHTFASHLVQNGVDLYRVSKLLGHTSIKMTEIYAHLAPSDLHEAIKKLPHL